MVTARRGDVVIGIFPGDYKEPRPAVVIQADWFRRLDSLTVCLLTTHGLNVNIHIRPVIEPVGPKGKRSQVQIDKIITIRKERISRIVGRVQTREMLAIDRALAEFLGLRIRTMGK